MTEFSAYDLMERRVESLGISCSVTRFQLVLGTQNATTGWYAKSYVESTIKMVIQERDAQTIETEAGGHAVISAVGYTKAAVNDGDLIRDSFDRTWLIVTAAPHTVGNQFLFNICGLSPSSLSEAVEGPPPGLGEGAYWILAIVGDAGCVPNPNGVQFIPAGESIDVTVTVNEDEFDWSHWVLDGASFSTDLDITVPAQTVGVVHILSALTLRESTRPIGPVLGPGWIESVEVGAVALLSDSFLRVDSFATATAYALNDTFGRGEGLTVTNS